jgi:hypothetical protein
LGTPRPLAGQAWIVGPEFVDYRDDPKDEEPTSDSIKILPGLDRVVQMIPKKGEGQTNH